MKYKVRAAAARDLDQAADWHREHSVDPRVAVRFLLEVSAVFETIAETPRAFPEVHGDIRRCRVLAFPAYSVFYRVLTDVVVITTVFHGHRRPQGWGAHDLGPRPAVLWVDAPGAMVTGHSRWRA